MLQPIKFLRLSMFYQTSEHVAFTHGPNPEPIRVNIGGQEKWLTQRNYLEEHNANLQLLIQDTVTTYCKEYLARSGSLFTEHEHLGPIGFLVQVEDQNKNTFIKKFAFVGTLIPSRYVVDTERRKQEIQIQQQMIKDLRTLDKDVTLFTLIDNDYCATTIDWIYNHAHWNKDSDLVRMRGIHNQLNTTSGKMVVLNRRQAHKLTQFTLHQLQVPWIRFYGMYYTPKLNRGYLGNTDPENYKKIKPVISEMCRERKDAKCVGVYGNIGRTRSEKRKNEQITIKRIRLWMNRFPHLEFTREYRNVGESTYCFFFCSVRR